MGLLDILNGMQNGPRGQRQPTPPGQGGGMSPIMMALLGLLAYKAMKGFGGSGAPASGAPQSLPPGTRTAEGGGGLGDILGGMLGGPRGGTMSGNAGGQGGGLGDLLGGILGGGQQPGGMARGGAGGGGLGDMLGGMLGGAAAGSVLSGGLGQVLQDLQRSGQGRTAQSWVGRGENEPIAPDDLANALGADTISALTQQTGLSRDDLLAGLSQNLPDFVDQLTPEGHLPTEEEASRW
jgi:uncharacterized protein YidB (DUF937 family)